MATLENEGSVFQAKQNQQQASYFAPFLPNRYVFIFISIERRKLSILQKNDKLTNYIVRSINRPAMKTENATF